jgi:hypothetical protein
VNASNVTAFVPNAYAGVSSDSLISEAFAGVSSDYSKRSPKTSGDTLGILLASGSLQPVQESGSGVDVVLTNSGYMAVFGKDNSVSGTGSSLITAITTISPDGKNFSKYDLSLVGYWDMASLTSS